MKKTISLLIIAFSLKLSSESKNIELPLQTPTPWLKSRLELYKNMPQGGIVAEIGVMIGVGAEQILKNNNPKKLYLIDHWRQDKYFSKRTQDGWFKMVCEKFKNDKRVEIIKGESIDIAKTFKDGFFDWIYIDAAHDYTSVTNDLNAWFNKVKSSGFITGHDYGIHPRDSYGVIKAVNELLKQKNLKMSYLTNENPGVTIGVYRSFAIKKD